MNLAEAQKNYPSAYKAAVARIGVITQCTGMYSWMIGVGIVKQGDREFLEVLLVTDMDINETGADSSFLRVQAPIEKQPFLRLVE